MAYIYMDEIFYTTYTHGLRNEEIIILILLSSASFEYI